MPLYFFHLRDGKDILLDPEGSELETMAAAQTRALRSARSILSAEALEGKLPLNLRIDVEDVEGTIVHSVRFEDAIEQIPPDD